MRAKTFVLALAVVLAASITTGCGDSQDSEDAYESEQVEYVSLDEAKQYVEDLELTDSFYTVEPGRVDVVVGISNPNGGFAPAQTSLYLLGRDADDKLIFLEQAHVSAVLPDTTVYVQRTIWDDQIDESVSVSFEILVRNGEWYKTEQSTDFYKIENVKTTENTWGELETTGELTLTRDVKTVGYNDARQPDVVAVYRDKLGKVVGASSEYIYDKISVGKAVEFTITSSREIADYATVEVHAYPS